MWNIKERKKDNKRGCKCEIKRNDKRDGEKKQSARERESARKRKIKRKRAREKERAEESTRTRTRKESYR